MDIIFNSPINIDPEKLSQDLAEIIEKEGVNIMIKEKSKDKKILRISTKDQGPQMSSGLKFLIGDEELGEIKSFKLGSPDGDGSIGPNQVLTATIEVAVLFEG